MIGKGASAWILVPIQNGIVIGSIGKDVVQRLQYALMIGQGTKGDLVVNGIIFVAAVRVNDQYESQAVKVRQVSDECDDKHKHTNQNTHTHTHTHLSKAT